MMDLLTFAFELTRIGLDNAVIEYSRPAPWEDRATPAMHCPFHAASWQTTKPPTVATLLEDAKRQHWNITAVRKSDGKYHCSMCETHRLILATAHPAPWKKGES